MGDGLLIGDGLVGPAGGRGLQDADRRTGRVSGETCRGRPRGSQPRHRAQGICPTGRCARSAFLEWSHMVATGPRAKATVAQRRAGPPTPSPHALCSPCRPGRPRLRACCALAAMQQFRAGVRPEGVGGDDRDDGSSPCWWARPTVPSSRHTRQVRASPRRSGRAATWASRSASASMASTGVRWTWVHRVDIAPHPREPLPSRLPKPPTRSTVGASGPTASAARPGRSRGLRRRHGRSGRSATSRTAAE